MEENQIWEQQNVIQEKEVHTDIGNQFVDLGIMIKVIHDMYEHSSFMITPLS